MSTQDPQPAPGTIAPHSPYGYHVVQEMLAQKRKFFHELGQQHAFNGTPALTDSNHPIFHAGVADIHHAATLHAAAEAQHAKAVHEQIHQAIQDHKTEISDLETARKKTLSDQPEPWSFWHGGIYLIFALLVLIGEFPFGAATFADALDIEIGALWLMKDGILVYFGAIGLVASTAALKILIGFCREFFRTPWQWTMRRLGIFLITGVCLVVFTEAFWSLGEYRTYIAREKSLNAQVKNVSKELLTELQLQDRDSGIDNPEKIKELKKEISDLNNEVNQTIQSKEQSELAFFTFFTLWFPIACGLLSLEHYQIQKRAQRIKRIDGSIDTAKRNLSECETIAKAKDEAHHKAQATANALGNAQALQKELAATFWLQYTFGHESKRLDPSILTEGPDLFERAQLSMIQSTPTFTPSPN